MFERWELVGLLLRRYFRANLLLFLVYLPVAMLWVVAPLACWSEAENNERGVNAMKGMEECWGAAVEVAAGVGGMAALVYVVSPLALCVWVGRRPLDVLSSPHYYEQIGALYLHMDGARVHLMPLLIALDLLYPLQLALLTHPLVQMAVIAATAALHCLLLALLRPYYDQRHNIFAVAYYLLLALLAITGVVIADSHELDTALITTAALAILCASTLPLLSVLFLRAYRAARAYLRPKGIHGLLDDESASGDVLSGLNIDPDDLILDAVPLAKGGFGAVYRGLYNETVVAVKTLLGNEAEDMAEFRRELISLCKLRHPNIVLLVGACADPPIIVLEYSERGSLYDVIRSTREAMSQRDASLVLPGEMLSWSRRFDVVVDAAKGLAYLHSQKPPIVHSDIKSLNILVTKAWNGKIADFGGSRTVGTSSGTDGDTGMIGTTRWASPEALELQELTPKADIFSFGMVLYEIVSLNIPYDEESFESQVRKHILAGHRPTVPSIVLPRFADFIRKCWDMLPSNRPSAVEVVRMLLAVREEQIDAIENARRALS
eukprot:TRINITY_DN1182_c0_g1_i1.p1 TRINITY_DN1182_c0_g1~~TRINITY_DN1182_c0_g1_i1.p1  ORF type:complete len:573 (+),score=135.57 TRINITY_DN1182_c0_g1_i1:78-1721(+)